MKTNKTDSSSVPRVLIIGSSYSIKDGGGITINNLFESWPIEKLAISAQQIHIDENVKWRHYYQIGSLEEKLSFPFSKFYTKNTYSGVLNREELIDFKDHNKNSLLKSNVIFSFLFQIGKNIAHFFGIPTLLSKNLIPSDKYILWIKKFNPEILYVIPVNYKMTKFMSEVCDILNIPMVVHIMDDYKKRTKPGIFYYYFERQLNEIFIKIVRKAQLHFSISEGMSEEYMNRFDKKFYPYHNPVDIEKLNIHKKLISKPKNSFRILQLGNITFWRVGGLYNICKAITFLNMTEEFKITLDIYSQNIKKYRSVYKLFSKFDDVTIHNPISHDEILKIISTYDLVILTTNFDKTAINFLQFSYSTNTSELMASGTPILVYAPEQIKFVQSAQLYKWAYTITEEDSDNLKNHIKKIIKEPAILQEIAECAMKYVKAHDEIKTVQKSFAKHFSELLVSKQINEIQPDANNHVTA